MAATMNEKDLEIGVIRQQAQANVENVATLASSENMEEQVQASVDVRETSMTNVNKIEVESSRK